MSETLEGPENKPVTIPNDAVFGGEKINPSAKLPDEHSSEKANKRGWLAAMTSAHNKRAEVGDDEVTQNLGEIVEAAMQHGLAKREIAEHLTEIGVDVTLKPDSENQPLVEPSLEKDKSFPDWARELVHTDEYRVFLHRTSKEWAENIMKSGFNAGFGLDRTATKSGSTPEAAFEDFQRIHNRPNTVVILRLPQSLFDEVDRNKNIGAEPSTIDELMTERYFDMDKSGIIVPKEWVFGYADQTTLELTRNPDYNKELMNPQ